MFQKIKEWLKGKYIDSADISPAAKASTHNVDIRAKESIKKFNKSFDQQTQNMQVRALKPHDISCGDIMTCKKRKCFKKTPDKIVSDSYEVKRGE